MGCKLLSFSHVDCGSNCYWLTVIVLMVGLGIIWVVLVWLSFFNYSVWMS